MSNHTHKSKNKNPGIAETLAALKEGETGKMPSVVYYGLSNLTPSDLEQLETVWDTLDPDYRRKVVRRLADVAESNFELDYAPFGLLALDDGDPGVREAAIELLFLDMSVNVMDRLIELAQWDEATEVRAAAASALGRFILAGELEEMPESETMRAQEAALSLWLNEEEEVDVRRRALEALANSSHEIVPEAIREAYDSHDQAMRVSSLFAMGRSCDKQWQDIVLRELVSSDSEMRYEAARAAGEIVLPEAVPTLVRLAFQSDREIKEVAIWALGEIGGGDSLRALDKLSRDARQADDDELLEVVEEAIMNANLVGDLDKLDLDNLSRFDD